MPKRAARSTEMAGEELFYPFRAGWKCTSRIFYVVHIWSRFGLFSLDISIKRERKKEDVPDVPPDYRNSTHARLRTRTCKRTSKVVVHPVHFAKVPGERAIYTFFSRYIPGTSLIVALPLASKYLYSDQGF
jgi:hypothetical protein